MWKQCKIAARWGAFIGMLVAFVSLLFFMTCPTVTYPNAGGWVSVHGSSELIRTVQLDFDDRHHGVKHSLDGLDYVRERINQYSPSSVTMRVPYGVFVIPLVIISISAIIVMLIMGALYLIVALCWLLPPNAAQLEPLRGNC